ncbi:MAG: hypothetical protein HOP06_06745 [Methylotenera sp.]|nr:hypothetical protein [Methylotenera sp.]
MTKQHDTSLIQHAFIKWFKDSSQLFSTPLTITKHTKQSIELTFTNANSMISATLTSREISVQFNWDGIFWDYLIYFEAVPEFYRGYYVDSLRHADDDTFYVNRELLWETRLFEPFLAWVNNNLINTPCIVIYRHDKSFPTVKLLDSPPENLSFIKNSDEIVIANPLYKKAITIQH